MGENYDGEIVLGTALDTTQLKKQLKDEERELQKYQDNHKVLVESKMETEENLKPLQEQLEQIEKNKQKAQEYLDKLHELRSAMMEERPFADSPKTEKYLELEAEADAVLKRYNAIQEQQNAEEEITKQYTEQKSKLDEITNAIKQNETNQDDLKESIKETNEELQDRFHVEDIKDSIASINKGLGRIVTKALKWGLAIFGIRTMFNFIRNSMSTIAQGDPQLKADIDYMKNILAYVIEPIIRKIVEWAKQLLIFVGAIIQRWTGKNIFQKANENLKKAKDNAKALQKTMAKFDEMNVLNGGNNTPEPSFNLADEVDKFDLNKPYEKVTEFLDKIRTTFNTTFDEIESNIANTMLDAGVPSTFVGLWLNAIDGIQQAINGIGEVFEGVFDVIYGIITGDKDKIWEGIKKICVGIMDIIQGTWDFIWNSLLLLLGILWEKVKDISKWVWYNILKPIIDFVVSFASSIVTILSAPIKVITSLFSEVGSGFFEIFRGILRFLSGDFKGGITDIFNGLKRILLAPINALIDGINQLIKGVNKIKFDVPSWVPGIGGNRWGFNLKTIPKIQLAKGGILNNPGKGVPVGPNAIAGESGKEFYMPLQDEQMLSLVGEAIGKHVVINTTLVNKMNGRVLSREILKVNNESDFAYNR